jgi:hypothetical protein
VHGIYQHSEAVTWNLEYDGDDQYGGGGIKMPVPFEALSL